MLRSNPRGNYLLLKRWKMFLIFEAETFPISARGISLFITWRAFRLPSLQFHGGRNVARQCDRHWMGSLWAHTLDCLRRMVHKKASDRNDAYWVKREVLVGFDFQWNHFTTDAHQWEVRFQSSNRLCRMKEKKVSSQYGGALNKRGNLQREGECLQTM